MKREEVLQQAMQKDRQGQYCSPKKNFSLVADLWSIYTGHRFSPADVAIMLILLKIARERTGKSNIDNYVDIAEYAALAAEVSGIEWREDDELPVPVSTSKEKVKRSVGEIKSAPGSNNNGDKYDSDEGAWEV